jgi:hypothetical protein
MKVLLAVGIGGLAQAADQPGQALSELLWASRAQLLP